MPFHAKIILHEREAKVLWTPIQRETTFYRHLNTAILPTFVLLKFQANANHLVSNKPSQMQQLPSGLYLLCAKSRMEAVCPEQSATTFPSLTSKRRTRPSRVATKISDAELFLLIILTTPLPIRSEWRET